MIFDQAHLEAFWQVKTHREENFMKELIAYINGQGWFKSNESELFRFLSRRSVKVETRLSKPEIERMIRQMLPHATISRWDENDLILDMDPSKLKREVVKDAEIFMPAHKPRTILGDYTICPIVKGETTAHYLIIQ